MAKYKITEGSVKWNGSFTSLKVSFNDNPEEYWESPSNDPDAIADQLAKAAKDLEKPVEELDESKDPLKEGEVVEV